MKLSPFQANYLQRHPTRALLQKVLLSVTLWSCIALLDNAPIHLLTSSTCSIPPNAWRHVHPATPTRGLRLLMMQGTRRAMSKGAQAGHGTLSAGIELQWNTATCKSIRSDLIHWTISFTQATAHPCPMLVLQYMLHIVCPIIVVIVGWTPRNLQINIKSRIARFIDHRRPRAIHMILGRKITNKREYGLSG